MFDRLVVGWSDSPSGAAAVAWAAARAGSTPILLANVVSGHETGTDYLSATSPESGARVRLMEAADVLRNEHPDAVITSEVVRGPVTIGLLALASTESLLVVGGTPGGQKIGPFGWSVGSRLAASRDPGAVAVVPADTAPTSRTGIVVGYDGTSASEKVLEVAISEALAAQQELHIVHAWSYPPEWEDMYLPDLGLEDSLEEVHQAVLDTALARARAIPGLASRGSLVADSTPHALMAAARTASELVVGNHGYHGVRRLFLGSASHAVIRGLVAPTLVVRS